MVPPFKQNSKRPLKIGLNAPLKANDRLPNHPFSRCSVSFMQGVNLVKTENPCPKPRLNLKSFLVQVWKHVFFFTNKTRWWFQMCFYVRSYMGIWSNLTICFFQIGWNHQLEKQLHWKNPDMEIAMWCAVVSNILFLFHFSSAKKNLTFTGFSQPDPFLK